MDNRDYDKTVRLPKHKKPQQKPEQRDDERMDKPGQDEMPEHEE